MQSDAMGVMAQDLEPLVGLFRLLSDKTRLNILMILAKGERNVSSLCTELGLPQPTVSHHLGLLRTKNLISNRRNGKQVFYGLNSQIDVATGDMLHVAMEPFRIRITDSAAT
ncbi:MAG TPA: metalloregulator ArsR/SmtB family transcription factor [Tepidisphaeraceae bacterium]|nr:metalloregulator ArsR/SmtB family transcription factor [Tepidisphaeraceae bacterium]